MINIKIYFTIDENGYLVEYSSTSMNTENEFMLDIDDNHELLNSMPYFFKFVDGKIIKDENRERQIKEEILREKNKPSDIERLEMAIMELAILVLGNKEAN